jgi:hypothetical protein
MYENILQKIGKANREAWEAVGRAAEAGGERNKRQALYRLPWGEIRRQLRLNGDTVDTLAVPVCWTNESPQMVNMRLILKKAGFTEEGEIYRWEI